MKTVRLNLFPPAVALTTLFVAGCSNDDDDSDPATSAPTATEVPEATTPGPAETSAPTATKDSAETDDSDDDAPGDDNAADVPGAGADLALSGIAALETAVGETGGQPYAIDDDDGHWEIAVAARGGGLELRVARDGTTVLGSTEEQLDPDDAAVDQATVSLPEAIAIVVREFPGQLQEAELESTAGQLSWHVTIDTVDSGETAVAVDARSGELIGTDG